MIFPIAWKIKRDGDMPSSCEVPRSAFQTILRKAREAVQKDFQNFLNFSRRSVFENANIVLFLNRRGVLDEATKDRLVDELKILAAKISAFSKTLGTGD